MYSKIFDVCFFDNLYAKMETGYSRSGYFFPSEFKNVQ